MRDLSIRGAGNILGAEQHGFMDSVGFDLYTQMLKEAIDSRKLGKPVEAVQPFNPELNVIVDAYIPDEYIEDEKQKIDVYKRFQSFETESDIRDLQDELIDRFGDYPEEVDKLFLVSYLKMVAKKERVEVINEEKKRTELILEEERSLKIDGSKLFELASTYGDNIQLGTVGSKLKIIFTWEDESYREKYEYIGKFIEQLQHVNQQEVEKQSERVDT